MLATNSRGIVATLIAMSLPKVLRRYFRRKGYKQIPLPGLPGSEEFMAAYQAAVAGTTSSRDIGANHTKPGTVNAAIVGNPTGL
jgi:hypothetical protein